MRKVLKFKWTVSRARDSYGYNVCTLLVDGEKASRCNGGGYDMKGTALGDWFARAYSDRLNALKPEDMPNDHNGKPYFYGLSYHDPHYDPGQYKPEPDGTFITEEDRGKTVSELEAEGKSLGLDRYQAFYRGSSKHPTERHTIPLIDGGCGFSSVEKIISACGFCLEYVDRETYILRGKEEGGGNCPVIYHLTKDGKTALCGAKSKNRIHVTYFDRILDAGEWCKTCQQKHGK